MRGRWTLEDLTRVNTRLRDQIANPLEVSGPLIPVPRPKYGNVKVEFHGQKFDSEGELKVYKDLKLQELSGDIRSVIRQVSLPLQGSNRRMRIDFLIVNKDGSIRWCDFKGYATPEWMAKRDQIQSAYGLNIEIIT